MEFILDDIIELMLVFLGGIMIMWLCRKMSFFSRNLC